MRTVQSYVTRSNSTLHEALLDLMGAINSPQSDEKLLRHAGVPLDRGLYPLLVRIARNPITVNELAEQVGRDQSTVSRQLQTLEQLGLVTRKAAAADQRVRIVAVTRAGRGAVKKIGDARDRLTNEALGDWSATDRAELSRLMRKLANSVCDSMKRP